MAEAKKKIRNKVTKGIDGTFLKKKKSKIKNRGEIIKKEKKKKIAVLRHSRASTHEVQTIPSMK